MPRIRINRQKYLCRDMTEFILGRMRTLNLTQEDMGAEFGITQQAFGARVRMCTFSYSDLPKLFKLLQATDEEILRLMKL